MENKAVKTPPAITQAQRLTDDALSRVSGGAGYSSIQCKKCGKTFTGMDEYRLHIEEAHTSGKRKP